jgi:hypothetical protein
VIIAAAVPAAIALPGVGSHRAVGDAISSGLYAPPPTDPNICSSTGGATSKSPSSYPKLLMLPPHVPMTYAFTNPGGPPRCNYFPHVAGTITKGTGAQVQQGAAIYGPNAASASQQGETAGEFAGQIIHPSVGDATATSYYIPANKSAESFWTDGQGGQWQATTIGFDATQLAAFLGAVRYNPTRGTAMARGDLIHAGYVNGPRARDWTGPLDGVFYAEWQEPHGRAALWTAPGPDRITQIEATRRGAVLVPINGRPGVLSLHGSYLVWQVRPHVTATLSVKRADAASIIQIAQSIRPISPEDSRLYRP